MIHIKVDEKYKHKYIKVRARACSTCGKKSEWTEKKFFVNCRFYPLSVAAVSRYEYVIASTCDTCQKVRYYVGEKKDIDESDAIYNGERIAVASTSSEPDIKTINAKSFCEVTGATGPQVQKTIVSPGAQLIGDGNGNVLGIKSLKPIMGVNYGSTNNR